MTLSMSLSVCLSIPVHPSVSLSLYPLSSLCPYLLIYPLESCTLFFYTSHSTSLSSTTYLQLSPFKISLFLILFLCYHFSLHFPTLFFISLLFSIIHPFISIPILITFFSRRKINLRLFFCNPRRPHSHPLNVSFNFTRWADLVSSAFVGKI